MALGVGLTLTVEWIAHELGEPVALYFIGPCLGLIVGLFLFFLTQDRLTDSGRNKHWAWLLLLPAVNVIAIVIFGCLPPKKT